MHLLLVEDNSADAALIREMIDQMPEVSSLVWAITLADAIEQLKSESCCNLVLLDLNLPDSEGLETLNGLTAARPEAPVVILTGLNDRETAMSAIRDGAQDYLVKGMIDQQLLERTVFYACERHRLRAALEESMERMQLAASVMEATLEGIFITDAAFRIIEINPAFQDITGLELKEVKGASPRIMGAGHYEEERYREMEQSVINNGFWQGEVWNRRRDGDVYAAWLNVNALQNSNGRDTGYVGIFTDITQRKLLEQHFKKMAHYDVLTGLPNRALFADRLDQALQQARRSRTKVGLLYFDLDQFKPINDTLGHDAGDLILQELAQRLQGCVRKSDTVARLGGDEFTIILPELEEPAGAVRIAEKCLTAIAPPFVVKKRECRLGVSIGIALFPDHGENHQTLLQKADEAMYRAKAAEGNTHRLAS